MRIGFVSVYAWRPHVEHLHYLALLAAEAGHETRFLACDGDLPACYSRELRPHSPAAWECFKCRAGGIRSFSAQGVTSIGELAPKAAGDMGRYANWSGSSANTLWRFEAPEEFESDLALATAAKLAPGVARAYQAALRWIERESLDGIYLFNGRMDNTRSVLEAARTTGVPFVSVERSWFGGGISLLPGEDCLGLKNIDRLVGECSERPLTPAQAVQIGRRVASRFMRVNTTEWRAYNVHASRSAWPASGSGPRVLLLPSSRNEVHGHADRASGWRDPLDALDAVMDHLALKGTDCVLRCHPNWSERIGHATGERPERHYSDWARRRGVAVIASADSTSTLGLIEEADAIVVNGSSAGLDAGVLGKQVISTAPSTYQTAGYAHRVYCAEDVPLLGPIARSGQTPRGPLVDHIARRALRYGYAMVARQPQFVDFVRSTSALDYSYFKGADASRIRTLLQGELLDDDPGFGDSMAGEDDVLDLIRQRRWRGLLDAPVNGRPDTDRFNVARRPAFQATARLRRLWPTGDR